MRSGGLVATASSGPVQVSKVFFYVFCHLTILIFFHSPFFRASRPHRSRSSSKAWTTRCVLIPSSKEAVVFHFQKRLNIWTKDLTIPLFSGVAEQFIQPAAEPDLQPSGGGPLRADVQGARPEPVRASGLGAQQLLLQGAQGRNQLGAVQVNPK